VTIHVNNRKLAEGFYRGLGVDDHLEVLQRVDKLDKIGPDAVRRLLVDEVAMSADAADRCLALAAITSDDESFADEVRALGVSHPLLDEGLDELTAVVRAARASVPGRVVADLRIARGLDYYTGTVYETSMAGYERLGSICSGGRYDSLASDGRTTYPGVGISVGVTRILGVLIGQGRLVASRSVPTCVLVAVDSEETRPDSLTVAAALRARGIPTEVAPRADRFGKQIRYADRRGIPYVWFPSAGSADTAGSVKDIRSGEQVDADAGTWLPPASDLHPTVGAASD